MNGSEIRRLRESRGLTQEQLARELRVGVRTIGGWERGEVVPKNRMGMLLDFVGVTDDENGGPDPLREASDLALLAELTRRAIDRERR